MMTQSYYLRDPRVRREAEALQDAGFQVHVIGLKDARESWTETRNGVRIFRVPLSRQRGSVLRYLFEYFAFFFLSALYLNVLHARHRYSAVYVHTMPDFLVFAGAVQKIWGVPIVLDVHEPFAESFSEKYGFSEGHPVIKLLKAIERISFRFADHLFTVSEPLRRLFVSRGTDPSRISVVLNVPDDRIFEMRVQSEPASSRNGGMTMAYTGTLAPRYGVDLVLEAMVRVASQAADIRLLIVGEGDALPALKEQINRLGLGGRVRLVPPVPIDQVPRVISEAHVGISPHRDGIFWKYYFSTKVVEFLVMGKPVICSRTETIQHYFNENTLLFFEPGSVESLSETMLYAYYNQQRLAKQLPERLTSVQAFRWSVHKNLYVRQVKELITGA